MFPVSNINHESIRLDGKGVFTWKTKLGKEQNKGLKIEARHLLTLIKLDFLRVYFALERRVVKYHLCLKLVRIILKT